MLETIVETRTPHNQIYITRGRERRLLQFVGRPSLLFLRESDPIFAVGDFALILRGTLFHDSLVHSGCGVFCISTPDDDMVRGA